MSGRRRTLCEMVTVVGALMLLAAVVAAGGFR